MDRQSFRVKGRFYGSVVILGKYNILLSNCTYFLATNFAYFIGYPDLVDNCYYITVVILVAFWLATVISFCGLKANKYLVDIGRS